MDRQAVRAGYVPREPSVPLFPQPARLAQRPLPVALAGQGSRPLLSYSHLLPQALGVEVSNLNANSLWSPVYTISTRPGQS